MHLDPELLSRLQFAWVVGWHILLPAFTVGLASFIALLEGAYALTQHPVFLRLSQFWLRIFAISFGMGVVTGIVMPFQFGTNWSRFSDAAGNVISPLLAYEGLTAFFLEAAFLGVLLFGRKLVPPAMHFRRGPPRCGRHVVLVVLDSGHQQLDADAGWLRGDRRPLLPEGLDRDHLQSVLPLSTRAHGERVLCHHRVCRARRRGLHGAARSIVAEGPRDAAARAVVPRDLRAAANRARRHARPQHARISARQARGDGGVVGWRRGVPASIIGWPDQAAERNHRRDRNPEARQPLSHPFVGR